jgi:hypothetical protein
MLPNFFTWLPIHHLPLIPDHFIAQAIGIAKTANQNSENYLVSQGLTNKSYQDRILTRQGKNIPTRYQQAFSLGDSWNHWVRTNIFPKFFDTSLRVNIGNSDTHGAHVDNPGRVRLFYLVDAGGENAETVFYHKSGWPFVHDADANQKINERSISYDNIDELTVVERVKFPLHQWILFNGYVLHGVENITHNRVNFTVDLKPEHFNFTIVPR